MDKTQEYKKYQDNIRKLVLQGKDFYSSEMFEQYKLRNTFGLDSAKKIHRIFQKEFYDKDISEGFITLPIASSTIWHDPLENPLEDVTGIDPDTGDIIDYGSLVRTFYALCWTDRLSPTSIDWQNFSHGKRR